MKMYLISDNVDTYTGMRLAGVDGVVVHEKQELRDALETAMNDKSIGIILLTERFAGSCAAILYRALFGRMHWSVWVAGLGCGIVFLMISKWSQEGIGYGDSWMILNMGIFLGIWNLLGMLMLAFLVAAMAAGAGLWSGKWKRTTRMSFYPFLLIGYLGTFIW